MKLIAACWTTAGNVRPGDKVEVSPWAFEDRVRATAQAGFTGFGILHADLVATRERIGLSAMKSILDDNSITTVEFEVLTDWFTEDARREEYDRMWRDFADAAGHIRPKHIKAVGDTSGYPWPVALMADRFAEICDRAAEVGTQIVLEPMPFSSIADLPTALEIVSGCSAGRLLLDVWHVARGGMSLADIASLDADAIGHIELDDAAAAVRGTLWEDTVDNRLLCGEGDLDLAGFLAAIHATGYKGTYGVEIISAAHRGRPLDDATTAAHTTTVAVLEK
jgi:sugar phosphate isomerase/epimerase